MQGEAKMLREPVCLQDFEDCAKLSLPKYVFDYYASGAGDEQTIEESKNVFKRLKLRPRFLRDVSTIDTKTTVLGDEIDFPLCISPTAMHKLAHPDGEMATARAAAQAGTAMVLSCWSTTSLEDVSRSSSGLKWFQIDIFKQFDVMVEIVKRAELEGYKAIVLTIDVPYFGTQYRNIRNHFALPTHLSFCNLKSLFNKTASLKADVAFADATHNPSATWEVIHWLRNATKLPIVVKGILTAEDAKLAVQHGVDAILVSNHGGRQIDGVPATIEALPEIVSAVGDKVEIYLDGGVRFGTDVFKALALGARAVFVGRPILWGLAYEGEKGVYKVLRMLKNELRSAMGLSGCATLKDIVKEMVVHESHYILNSPSCNRGGV